MNKEKGILIAFGELFLKSKGVKSIFEKRLLENLCFYLKDAKIISFRERIVVITNDDIKDIIGRMFGISWFSECFIFSNFNELKEFDFNGLIGKKETFALRVVNSKKEDVIKAIADGIDRKVDLTNPDKEIFIENRKNLWFLYFKKEKGAGGLPLGSSGRVLSLMSGGIDSPVSSYLMAKRGANNVWVHFHSFPLVSNLSIKKVEELARVFIKFQPNLKVYFVPFHRVQMEIKAKADPKYRVLLYRRQMIRISQEIARKEKCQALITGESLGQVSSQTLNNLSIIEDAAEIPILRPVVGMDKEEIIDIARKIGTFDISIKPQEDCCTLFVSKHQTAHGSLKEIKDIEKKLNIKPDIKPLTTIFSLNKV